MFETLNIDEEVLSTKKGSSFSLAKGFSEFMQKHCDKYLSDEVKISFNFSLNFLEEVSMISLTKKTYGKIICEGSVLIVRQDERLEFNFKIGFLNIPFMKGIFEIGTIDLL